MALVYCITHEAWFVEGGYNDADCIVTTSAPPELDMSDNWLDSLVEPDSDELILMDLSAEALEIELGLV